MRNVKQEAQNLKKTILVTFLLIIPVILNAQNFQKIQKKLKDYDKTYFIYIDKKVKKLYLMDKTMKIWRNYTIATGEKSGNKLYSGDFRTPRGIYKITEIYQYDEPWYLKRIEKKLKDIDKFDIEYRALKKQQKAMIKKYKKNKKRIKTLNSLYLKASEGHVKYGTKKSLGKDSYGPVFMRLNFPNKDDLKRYKKAKKAGKIPKNKWGGYKKPGSGIAIHGTNDNNSLGHDASAGCIRVKNNNIKELSKYVMKGTMVVID